MAPRKNTTSKTKRKRKSAPSRRVVAQDYKSLQKKFKKLKKLGLTRSKKKATAHNVSSKRIQNLIQRFDTIFTGQAAVVKTTRRTAKAYKEAGYETHGRNVIIEKAPDEKVYLKKAKRGDVQQIHRKKGNKEKGIIDWQIIPRHFTDLEDYFNHLKDHPEEAGKLSKNGRFVFRLFGHDTRIAGGFGTIESAIEYLKLYNSIAEAMSENDRKKQEEIYRGLEFYTITAAEAKHRQKNIDVFGGVDATGRNTKGGRSKKKRNWKEYRERQRERNPAQYNRYLDKQARLMAKRRKKLKQKE